MHQRNYRHRQHVCRPYLVGCMLACLLAVQVAAHTEPQPAGIGYLEAENLALRHNPQIQNAQAVIEGARADIITAGARPNAVMSVNASGVDNSQYQYGNKLNSLDTIVRIDQPFERGNKRDLRLAKANDLNQATLWDLQETIRQEKMRVLSAWLDLRVAEQRTQIAEANLAHAERVSEKARLRFKTGDLSGADLGRIEADSARLLAEAQMARRDRSRASAMLSSLLGNEMQHQLMATRGDWPPSLNHEAAEKMLDGSIEKRPDVQAARARLSAAKQAIELARAQRTRDFTVGLQYERNNPTVVNSVGGGIAIPLFTGNNFEGDIRRSMAEMTQAEIAMLQTERNARTEAKLLIRELDEANNRLRSLHEMALQSTRRTDKAADVAYSRGAMSTFEYLDIKRAVRQAEIEAVTARAEAAKASSAIRILSSLTESVTLAKPAHYDSPVEQLNPVNMPASHHQLPDLPGAASQ
ncbi:MAG: cobalt-zinc-cadmium resistance protein [Pseudomonadota bacterium]